MADTDGKQGGAQRGAQHRGDGRETQEGETNVFHHPAKNASDTQNSLI